LFEPEKRQGRYVQLQAPENSPSHTTPTPGRAEQDTAPLQDTLQTPHVADAPQLTSFATATDTVEIDSDRSMLVKVNSPKTATSRSTAVRASKRLNLSMMYLLVI